MVYVHEGESKTNLRLSQLIANAEFVIQIPTSPKKRSKKVARKTVKEYAGRQAYVQMSDSKYHHGTLWRNSKKRLFLEANESAFGPCFKYSQVQRIIIPRKDKQNSNSS